MTITKKIDFKAKVNCDQDLLALLKEMVVNSKVETGCVLYQLYQSKQHAQQIFLLEIWASNADLDAHKKTPHFKDFVLKLPALIEEKTSEELHNFL